MKRNAQNTYLGLIGDMNLGEVRSIDLQMATNELVKEGKYARKSINAALNCLISKFLNVTKGNWFYELYYTMTFMGLRIGEAGGLKWADVDF